MSTFDDYIASYIDFFSGGEGNNDFATYAGAVGAMIDQADSMVRDPNGNPPYSMLFDPANCPTAALAWLGQFVGVQLEVQSQFEDPAAYWARQRQRIAVPLGWSRGSAVAMEAAAAFLLTGNQTVMFRERDGSPYHLTIVTRTGETPNPALVQSALMALKPAGITLDYHTITGQDFAEVLANNTNFTAAKAAYPTFNDMRGY